MRTCLPAKTAAPIARAVHDAASHAFIRGLSVGCLVAAGVAVAGAVMAAALLPAQPSIPDVEPDEPDRMAAPAAAGTLSVSTRS